MRLYIDKENILSFMSKRNKDEDLFYESIHMIKAGMEVYYNFSKSDVASNPVLMAWFSRMRGSGVKFDSFFCPDLSMKPERPLKTNFYVNFSPVDRSSVYLLDIEEHICNIIKEKQCILIGRIGDEFDIFGKLLEIPERPRMMAKLQSWKQYCPQLPLTDVILCDNYYFKHSNVYRKNDNELIRSLASIPKDSLNLVIITKEGEIDSNIDLSIECGKIKDIVCKISNLSKKKCSVTIMTTNRIHSRHILTNYYRISPTSCVHLKDNGLKEDANILIESHADPSAAEATKDLINMFQSIASNPVRIYGDRRSNYIHFAG